MEIKKFLSLSALLSALPCVVSSCLPKREVWCSYGTVQVWWNQVKGSQTTNIEINKNMCECCFMKLSPIFTMSWGIIPFYIEVYVCYGPVRQYLNCLQTLKGSTVTQNMVIRGILWTILNFAKKRVAFQKQCFIVVMYMKYRIVLVLLYFFVLSWNDIGNNFKNVFIIVFN